MVDIPMVAKKPVKLSELDTAYFGRRQPTPTNLNGLNAGGWPHPSPPTPVQTPPAPAPSPPRPAKRRPAGNGTLVTKGQKTSLSQMNTNLDLLEVALGWELGPGGQAYDLDVEAFLLDQSGKALGDSWFVFYNQPISPDGAVRLLESSAAGDDAAIQIGLSQLNSGVAKIVFILTINEARELGRNFSQIQNAYVRVVDKRTGGELLRFHLTEYYHTVCSMVVGEVYRYKDEWRFNPVGDGTGEDLAGLCRRYGINVAG